MKNLKELFESTLVQENYDSEATELKIYVENDGMLYRQMVVPWTKNLMTKAVKGVFNKKLAIKGLANNLFTEGAKRYAKDFASPGEWSSIFPVPARKIAAEMWLEDFFAEAEIGNYDNDTFLPKKYLKDGSKNVDWEKLKK
jgi:hypothetical protein